MKKCFSLLLALVTALSVLAVTGSAADTEPLIVEDLLKHDADAATGVCRTVEIFIPQQFRNYDGTKEITFRDRNDGVAAICKPHDDNFCMFDLYTPDGEFGVRLDPTRLYYLTIPEGTYYTDEGVLCAAYRGEYDGVYLSDKSKDYTIADLGISEFLATNVRKNVLYAGRIRISLQFDSYRPVNSAVTLYRRTGVNKTTGRDEFVKVGVYSVTAFKKGGADVTFGGVEIDRCASYKLHVDYGEFFGPKSTINAHSEYVLSGKKLLGLREDYPAIDLLIGWFGADHRVLKSVTTALDVLAALRLVDKALAEDIRDYVNARKS